MKIAIIGGGPGGLYLSILLKQAAPAWDVVIYERNRPADTFGFGVVFSDETLDHFQMADAPSFRAVRESFAYWDAIDVFFKGEVIRSTGHGFCGIERKTLLMILVERAIELGVRIEVGCEVRDLGAVGEVDLVVGADGINSMVRESLRDEFHPRIEWRRNKFIWLGSRRQLPAFTFDFQENEHGIWCAGAYQYNASMSTWVFEAAEDVWRRASLDRADEAASVAYLERVFAERLAGAPLISNRSIWRTFPTIRCERWSHRNVVLLGDALHTAHYSIGSGTKLAMEDAIALRDALVVEKDVPAALKHFEEARREEVEKTQHAADVSTIWTENVRRYWGMDATQAAFSLLSRSKQITYENLKARDPAFVATVDRCFARDVSVTQHAVLDVETLPPPMFTPLKLRGMTVANRVVVSPMDMYSAEDGLLGDFHFVHLGGLALGGAGLVFSEMACVSREGRITPGCAGLYKPGHRGAWARIIEFVHRESDAKFCIQLGHCGRKGSTRLGWDGMDEPLENGNWPLISASALRYKPQSQLPKEMDDADMARVREAFVRGALMAEEAGADMLELHMAHGYLLSGFLSPLTNRRRDQYGGSVEARLCYPLAVFDAVRRIWPEAKPISVRISATDWVADGGLTPDEAVEIAAAFKQHGCDIIDVSAGQTVIEARPIYGRMFQTPFSDQIRNEVGIPTIAVGNITTADQVNTIVAAGRADLVALARPHLANPHFTLAASAHYGVEAQRWPLAYLTAKEQAYRLALRENAEAARLRAVAKPQAHGGTKDRRAAE